MAPSSKSAAAAAKDRRKSNNATAAAASSASPSKSTLTVTLKVPASKLRAIIDPDYVKEDSPAKESPSTSATLAAAASNTENGTDTTPGTPAAGTPAPTTMGPPVDGPKKKGVKRGPAAALGVNGEPKVRGKPGPKKKQRLEDGTIEGGRGSLAAHKLGPKANQGAINAGLRALDRSGKPCRKWARGGFTLKSFTGVVWEIPRWTAPPKGLPESSTDSSTPASADGSNKENKEDNSQAKSEASNNGGDIEMQSAPSIAAAASPAPIALAAATAA